MMINLTILAFDRPEKSVPADWGYESIPATLTCGWDKHGTADVD